MWEYKEESRGPHLECAEAANVAMTRWKCCGTKETLGFCLANPGSKFWAIGPILFWAVICLNPKVSESPSHRTPSMCVFDMHTAQGSALPATLHQNGHLRPR
ncbi:hypothetical protein PVK06_033864 [Gossypium arboreum]|uniref:Uncharacterized protein n=1 Tax=Gossypium arboreum TaxID=29729 RepID=A0ABR0NCZ3_GOSAR|nr:hypothetical protein PVK06_033864 [Gossypium arboreum]